MAQLASAPALGAGGRGFESHWPDHPPWNKCLGGFLFTGKQKDPVLRVFMVPRARIELATQGFSVLRSTTELSRQMPKARVS